jgi:hypothetical protein
MWSRCCGEREGVRERETSLGISYPIGFNIFYFIFPNFLYYNNVAL